MAPPPPPPELSPDVFDEILLRLPPDDPADLVRASAVCKPWLRTLSDPAFIRRYLAFHGTPPVLGFLDNSTDNYLARFVPTTALRPHTADTAHRTCSVLDCRHGRVLLYDYGCSEFVVWDPITGRERRIPDEDPDCTYSNHAVLCAAAAAGCDHSTCSGGPFLLASVGVDWGDDDLGEAFACFYSSETGAWSIQTHIEYNYDFNLLFRSASLVGGDLYFIGDFGKLLRYDVLSSQDLSVIELPKENHLGSVIVLPAEGGEFGLFNLYCNSLCVWSRENEVGRGASWVQHRVVDLDKLLPDNNPKYASFSGFAEDANVIFVSTHDRCVFSIDLKSMAVRKLGCQMSYGNHIIPYVCFYTPAACARGALPLPVETK